LKGAARENRVAGDGVSTVSITRGGSPMRRLISLLLAVVLLAVLVVPAVSARQTLVSRGIVVLAANMTGAAERPGPGDPDGRGVAAFLLNLETDQLCYFVAVRNITLPATGNHIHLAPPTDPGPVVVPLANPDETGIARGCVEVGSELLDNIANNPGAYYVNTHTLPDYAAGAVRGQLFRPFGGGVMLTGLMR
jgi:hypothetical protein